jgi:AraC-like DNA-binding protein
MALSRVPLRSSPAQQVIFDHRAAALLLELVDEGSRSVILSTEPGVYQAQQAWALIRSDFRTLHHLEEVASRVGVSYDYLRHCFRRLYGMSLKSYLIETRLERAKDLLRHSHLPLKAISDLCGFNSERHLCERFHADVGMSPGAFRRKR